MVGGGGVPAAKAASSNHADSFGFPPSVAATNLVVQQPPPPPPAPHCGAGSRLGNSPPGRTGLVALRRWRPPSLAGATDNPSNQQGPHNDQTNAADTQENSPPRRRLRGKRRHAEMEAGRPDAALSHGGPEANFPSHGRTGPVCLSSRQSLLRPRRADAPASGGSTEPVCLSSRQSLLRPRRADDSDSGGRTEPVCLSSRPQCLLRPRRADVQTSGSDQTVKDRSPSDLGAKPSHQTSVVVSWSCFCGFFGPSGATEHANVGQAEIYGAC